MLTQMGGGCLVHLDSQSGHRFPRKALEYMFHVNRHQKWTKLLCYSIWEYVLFEWIGAWVKTGKWDGWTVGCLAHFWNLSFLLLKNHTGILRPHYFFWMDTVMWTTTTHFGPLQTCLVWVSIIVILQGRWLPFFQVMNSTSTTSTSSSSSSWLYLSSLQPFKVTRQCWFKKPLSCRWCRWFSGILQMLKVPSNVSQRRGELGKLRVGLGEIIFLPRKNLSNYLFLRPFIGVIRLYITPTYISGAKTL